MLPLVPVWRFGNTRRRRSIRFRRIISASVSRKIRANKIPITPPALLPSAARYAIAVAVYRGSRCGRQIAQTWRSHAYSGDAEWKDGRQQQWRHLTRFHWQGTTNIPRRTTRRAPASGRSTEDYTRGFLHFLATSPRVPEYLHKRKCNRGACRRTSFVRLTAGQHQLYVREAHRMVSDYVMTEHNCRHSLKLPDAIGLAAYTMDSHNCRRIVRYGHAENEGDSQVGGFPPYPIAYRSIVPKAADCVKPVGAHLPFRKPHRLRLHSHGTSVHGIGTIRGSRSVRGNPRAGASSACQHYQASKALAGGKTNSGMEGKFNSMKFYRHRSARLSSQWWHWIISQSTSRTCRARA